MKPGLLVILVGPSGVGKSTFLERILEEFKDFRDIITYTSRTMRKGEREGCPYHFVSREGFKKLIEQNFFVEWAEVHGNLYGTPHSQILDHWQKGLSIIVDLDVQGAKALRREYAHAMTVFIHPPSVDELRQRIIKRDGKIPADLSIRLANAEKEISKAIEFDHQIVNSDLEKAYQLLKNLIEEKAKSS